MFTLRPEAHRVGMIGTNLSLSESERRERDARDAGLLVLRVGTAALIWAFHMRPKLGDLEHELVAFPDPLGIGHGASFALALLSEGLCSLAVAVGLLTRVAALPIVFTMAMVLVLAASGFEDADVQAALLYALPYVVIVFTGPGRWAIDERLAPRYRALWLRLRGRAPSRGVV